MATLQIKPNNHRVYPCTQERKIELIKKIVEENKNFSVVVACSKDAQSIAKSLDNTQITVIEDREFVTSDAMYDLLISYDMPIKALVYPARVAKITKKAILLLEESDQAMLHSIEMLLGRAIKQEVIEGFGFIEEKKPQELQQPIRKMSKDKIKEVAKKRYEAKTQDTPKEENKKVHTTPEKWQKKKKAPNKFLGYDENGKAKFSGKSGERNHRYDGKPKEFSNTSRKIGKKINITAKKS